MDLYEEYQKIRKARNIQDKKVWEIIEINLHDREALNELFNYMLTVSKFITPPFELSKTVIRQNPIDFGNLESEQERFLKHCEISTKGEILGLALQNFNEGRASKHTKFFQYFTEIPDCLLLFKNLEKLRIVNLLNENIIFPEGLKIKNFLIKSNVKSQMRSDSQYLTKSKYILDKSVFSKSLQTLSAINVEIIIPKNADIQDIHTNWNITSLYFSLNSIQNINWIIDSEFFTTLKLLTIDHNLLTTIPSSITNLKNLKSLTLTHNNIRDISDSIGSLTNLNRLHLDFNELTSLPKTICNLKNLTFFSASNNSLGEIPNNFGNLKNLEKIILNKNNLHQLPDSITDLSNLKVLSVSDNNLTVLSNNIHKLTSLEELYISNNPIEKLPEGIIKLQNLKAIYLFQTQIDENDTIFQDLLKKNSIDIII